MTILVLFLPILLAIMVGLGFLQAHLSKREEKIPGLIIPAIFFFLSLFWLLGMYYDGIDAVEILVELLIFNIPTFAYLAIYFVCREKYQKKNQMDRMNIQDLD